MENMYRLKNVCGGLLAVMLMGSFWLQGTSQPQPRPAKPGVKFEQHSKQETKQESAKKKRRRSRDELAAGDVAPEFMLQGNDTKEHKLSDYRGKKLVLYFYPKDFTSHCTSEACSLRDSYQLFEQHNIEVIGVSSDTIKSHQQFKEEHHLPFTLLSDPKSQVTNLYGAGGTFINGRVTYLIDEKGIIIHVFPHVTVEGHINEILKVFGIKD